MYGVRGWVDVIGRGAIAALAVGVGLAIVLSSAATATVPPTRCGKLEVGGKDYKVATHLLECDFARKWSRKYLKHGDHPGKFSCTSYSPEETRIAFSCQRGSASYYAVRK